MAVGQDNRVTTFPHAHPVAGLPPAVAAALQLVAVASLFLASKMENQGKSHMLLANQLLKEWYGKDNPQLLAMDEQRRQALAAASAAAQRRGGGAASEVLPVDPFRVMYDAVLEAERALLYTIGFDFNVDVIHVHLARVVNRPRMRAAGMHVHKIAQNTLVGVANDVYTKDSLLVLQVRCSLTCWQRLAWAAAGRQDSNNHCLGTSLGCMQGPFPASARLAVFRFEVYATHSPPPACLPPSPAAVPA